MLHGNISNQSSVPILIQVEDFLVKYKKSNFKDKVANFLVGKESRAEIDREVDWFIYWIYRDTSLVCDLAVYEKNFNTDLEKLLLPVSYGNLRIIRKPVEIAVWLNVNMYAYYSGSEKDIKEVNHKFALPFEELKTQMRGLS
jgi:hypothetical protein